MKNVLLLGASSWIGYLLSKRMTEEDRSLRVVGTVHTSAVEMPWLARSFRVSDYSQYHSILAQETPSLIINVLRGEGPADYQFHRELVDFCSECRSFYLYASSALALDGYPFGTRLVESLPPISITPYGVFKGRCEESLTQSGVPHLILRFSSIQGWVPHKITRNQRFLGRISRGEPVVVHQGIIQNRLYDETFVDMIIELLRAGATGVFNLGTINASSEVAFLRRQAEMFGWDSDLVIAGEARDVNLFVEPERLFSLLGDSLTKSEDDTLKSLANCPGLSRYKRQAN